jgi:molybdenum cofactor synthesis domain-containing protein
VTSGPGGTRAAVVITVSDGVAAGAREDASGPAVAARLADLGFTVARDVVADDRTAIAAAIAAGAERAPLVVTTGGTGLTPRDVTPEATADVVDRLVPGLAEAMRAAGRARTPLADLSRGIVGARGSALVVNLPGSPRGAVESLEAIEGALIHAVDTLAGPFDHTGWTGGADAGGDRERRAGG